MTTHTLSHADVLQWGNAVVPGNAKRGIRMDPIIQASLGAPATLDADGIISAVAVLAAGFVTMDGVLVAASVATLGGTYGRAVQIVSDAAGDTTQVITIRGRDAYGEPLTESMTLNGTTPVLGLKAFKTVLSVHASALLAGLLDVGTTDKLGLPFRLDGKYDMLRAYMDVTDELATGTLAAAVTTTPTALTGDVKGTWLPATATNGTRAYRLWYKVSGVANREQAFGKVNFNS